MTNPFATSFSSILIMCLLLPLLLFLFSKLKPYSKNPSFSSSNLIPRSYPIVGSFFSIMKNQQRFTQWTAEIVNSTPTLTFTLHRNFGTKNVITANPATVHHILKSNFHNYHKGRLFSASLRDLLGHGIFNTDGQNWKFQRQVASHEFNTKSLRKFVETVVDSELSDRLIPILEKAYEDTSVLDFQDILQRFAFDNICKIAFGYDPEYLSPSLPQETFAIAFEKAVKLSTMRFRTFIPYSWKIYKALNVGSEKELKIAVSQVREFATKIVREKIQAIQEKSAMDHSVDDLLSRFLSSGHSDEEFVTDIVISFILAGRDTTSAALTWFFWLLSNYPEVERNILMEIHEKAQLGGATSAYDEVKDMAYTHASLCESMRLYPPVPIDGKEALKDDILPDGTMVTKGTRVSYHPYAMGRVEKVWGKDWAEFRPERWLERDFSTDKWNFVNRQDAFTYSVFQAGPRICLGKDMAFSQMKRVVAGVLRRFRVVPATEKGVEPVYVTALTAKMQGGFPVRIEARADSGENF